MTKYIQSFKDKMLKENEEFENEEFENEYDENTSDLMDCLEALKKVNNRIHRQELISWFNDNDIDYHTMSDLDMYIYYIEANAK